MPASPRACPACGAAMEPRSAGGVEIDRCPACQGYWFDARELARAAGGVVPKVVPTGVSPRRCPECAIPLAAASIGDLHVDACGTCRGVWLDKGEFRQVQASADRAREQADARRPQLDADAGVKRTSEQEATGSLVRRLTSVVAELARGGTTPTGRVRR